VSWKTKMRGKGKLVLKAGVEDGVPEVGVPDAEDR
jgi:hypothetical protein